MLHAELVRMTDIVTSRIRSGVGGAKTWSIKVRLSDFTTLTRSHTWSIPIASTSEVIGVLDRLLVSAVNSRSVRLLGVSASGFGSAVQQLDLSRLQMLNKVAKMMRSTCKGSFWWRCASSCRVLTPKEMRIPRANVESSPSRAKLWRPSARR